MESQLNYYKQRGVTKNDLLSGLAYSIVENYLNKVVEKRRIGERIFFQGGVAYNRAVKSAFEQVLGKKVIVPPHHDILGAVGVAILAREEMAHALRPTLFKGFDLRDIQYESTSFECTDCPNNCEIHQVKFSQSVSRSVSQSVVRSTGRPADRQTLYYGSRCGKYDDDPDHDVHPERQSNLFKERERELLNSQLSQRDNSPIARVGIPRASVFYDLYPLWNTFFSELGLEVVLSDKTNRSIIKNGIENVIGEPCFPIKTAHGHILNLLEKDIDYLFLPFQVNMPALSEKFERSYNCPYIQALPDTTRSAINYNKYNVKILRPTFYMDRGRKEIEKTLKQTAKSIEHRVDDIDRAMQKAFEAQELFETFQSERGKQVLEKINQPSLVLITRSYNSYDTGLNLNLVEKLLKLGIMVIPIDFLPLKDVAEEIEEVYPFMYWRAGQKILAAARIIARTPNLFAVCLTNFQCGPDSYIMKFFEKEMHHKPYLSLEIDEHSSDVGMQTRCEAFLDTIKNIPRHSLGIYEPVSEKKITPTISFSSLSSRRNVGGNGLVLYIPYMDDHSFIVASAFRFAGIKAYALEPSDEQSLLVGRKHTSGRECLPSIITTGDILKKSFASDFVPNKSAFFMPSAKGPCRFGQYNKLHRMVLDEIGLSDVALITFDQTNNYHKDMKMLGSKRFKLNLWYGLVIMDLIQKLLRETRPYELTRGETDTVYQETLKELASFIEAGSDHRIEQFSSKIINRFDYIKTDKTIVKPKIGIIGEIYVRSNPFTNNNVVRILENLGAEVSLPPFEEWLDYIDYIREEDYLLKRQYLSYLKQKITVVIQEREANKIRRSFQGRLRHFAYEPAISGTIHLGAKYLAPALRGEAILSIGRAIEYIDHGFDGILNIIPFGCMPGTIVNALLNQLKTEYNIPILTMTYDGLKDPSEEMRLEAFVKSLEAK